jgi:hypothetical protein
LERSNHEKGSGLIGEASIQSDDAVFSDAVAEFSDSGSAAGTGEGLEGAQGSAANVERVANNDLNAIQFHNDGGTTGNLTMNLIFILFYFFLPLRGDIRYLYVSLRREKMILDT